MEIKKNDVLTAIQDVIEGKKIDYGELVVTFVEGKPSKIELKPVKRIVIS